MKKLKVGDITHNKKSGKKFVVKSYDERFKMWMVDDYVEPVIPLFEKRINEPDCERCSKGRIYAEKDVKASFKRILMKLENKTYYSDRLKIFNDELGEDFVNE